MLNSKFWCVALIAWGLALAFPAAARCEIILTVGDTVIRPGGTGFVDVQIRSTAASTDLLDIVGAEFRLTTAGGTTLAFVSSPPDEHLAESQYLFNGDSANQLLGPPAALVLDAPTLDDTYLGGDGTLSRSGVSVPTVDTLLFRLELTTLTDAPPVLGDVFTLTLIPGPSTIFLDPDFKDLPLHADSRLQGVITIAATEVPEPGSLVLLGLAATLGLLTRRHWNCRHHC
jgi:hypothetical protein